MKSQLTRNVVLLVEHVITDLYPVSDRPQIGGLTYAGEVCPLKVSVQVYLNNAIGDSFAEVLDGAVVRQYAQSVKNVSAF